ncbi:gamma-glutamyl-gamma-aminobutyrate hydrolase family protein [Planosporangium thailandense]|uniref:Gamma-glutamyl-gamma-aminobutyrate hydrolase family protein n=1 Tax=Planosporangium thailandense TaxID=765197 RepID=A0ABX0Y3V5_9ACTN|nr:gamma-glutamyl-gamma-aminobutyrate hydrolase family protein [Planosporangium thailandense]NJC73067.1 gamma-glutamyl-gamma-aminobutyrate hydrolase family protein [Planosporangium thailandense]
MQIRPRAARPVIGIGGVLTTATWGFWTQPAVLVAETYLSAVRVAGGSPVILPPADAADPADLLAAVDGVLLAGGNDVCADLYGQTAGVRMEEVTRERDLFELAIARYAFEHDVPVLGICRGLQILNVAAGGTLHQHLLDAGFAEHRPAPGRLDEAANHGLRVAPDSLLGRCGMAERCQVNSHHHQGVDTVGVGGRVVACSVPDGAVEAVEWPAQRFALGVQWHAESPAMPGIFDGFVRAAAERLSASAACEPSMARGAA